jgi:hypothetical protein
MAKIDVIRLVVDVAGSAGSATGSTTSIDGINGRVLAVHVDYTSQPATTDVTLTSSSPPQTILTLTNTNSDALIYSRRLLQGTDGTNLTAVYDAFIVAGKLTASVAQGDPVVGGVVVTVYVERG